jgi:hypothetical protein
VALARAVALASLAPLGCNLLVDIPDHHLAGYDPATSASDTSGGPGPGGAGGAGAGSGGATGASGTGGAGGCNIRTGPFPIATRQHLPSKLQPDSDHIYWINEKDGEVDGEIMRVKKSGCEPPVVIASGLSGPTSLKVSIGTYLFFTNDGSTPGTGIFRVPKEPGDAGAAIESLVEDGSTARALALSNYLFSEAWKAGLPVSLRRTSLVPGSAGGCFPFVAPAAGGRITAIVGDANAKELWFADTGSDRILHRPTTDCSAAATTVFADESDDVRALGSIADRIYWITATAVRYKLKTPDDAPIVTLSSTQVDLVGLWAFSDGAVVTSQDKLLLVSAGTTNVIIEGQGGPDHVIGNAQTLYWTNRASGEVMRYDDWQR